MNDSQHAMNILLVEDSPGDVHLTREALRSAQADANLHVATDGVEALAFLRRQAEHADAPRPDLILLDLNMPRVDGRQVLSAIKTDHNLLTIPVVVLTTSDAPSDVSLCYERYCNGYIVKPIELDDFFNVIRSVNDFWCHAIRLPTAVPC